MKKYKNTLLQSDELFYLKLRRNKYKKGKKKKLNINICTFLFFIIFFIIIFSVCYYLIIFKRKNNNQSDKNLNNINIKKSQNLIESYIKSQKDFCENPNKYINQKYEESIFLSDVNFNETKFQMYIFKSANFILNQFKKYGAFEIVESKNMIDALKFYSSKYNILNNKDIFMLDIGGNIGWYPSILGRYGYSILSFEAFEKNNYVAKKNYCLLNKESNVILITQGLGSEEKNCYYFNQRVNAGNGMVICDDKSKLKRIGPGKMFIKESQVKITTLNAFIPFLSTKHIALIKIDVEGHEFEVFEGGKELITKYHVPFITLEFSPSYLKDVGSNPRQLAQLFVDNGYKISIDGFFSKKYLTVDELLKKAGFQIDCYFIHDSIINNKE